MQATIIMINAWFEEPCQYTTHQTGWTQSFFPSDKVRICVASQLADCCSQSSCCSVCSLKGNCLDGCQHHWPGPHNSSLTLILTSGGQQEDVDILFIMFYNVFSLALTTTTNALLTLSQWYKRQSRWLGTAGNICKVAGIAQCSECKSRYYCNSPVWSYWA